MTSDISPGSTPSTVPEGENSLTLKLLSVMSQQLAENSVLLFVG